MLKPRQRAMAPTSNWPRRLPSAVQGLKPVAVLHFDSKSHPDGVGVLFVLERHRDWDAGVLICQQRNSEWQGVHRNGQIMSAGPDFGFRRLRKDECFGIGIGAVGRQPTRRNCAFFGKTRHKHERAHYEFDTEAVPGVIPGSWGKSIERESRTWMMRCSCGFERSVSEAGGIRWKAAGRKRSYLSCPKCRQWHWHAIEKAR